RPSAPATPAPKPCGAAYFLRSSVLLGGGILAGFAAFAACQEAAEGGDPVGVGSAGGDGVVQSAVGGRLGVRAATGTVRGDAGQVGERVDQLVRIDVGQAEGADAGGVDDPAALGQAQDQGVRRRMTAAA